MTYLLHMSSARVVDMSPPEMRCKPQAREKQQHEQHRHTHTQKNRHNNRFTGKCRLNNQFHFLHIDGTPIIIFQNPFAWIYPEIIIIYSPEICTALLILQYKQFYNHKNETMLSCLLLVCVLFTTAQ